MSDRDEHGCPHGWRMVCALCNPMDGLAPMVLPRSPAPARVGLDYTHIAPEGVFCAADILALNAQHLALVEQARKDLLKEVWAKYRTGDDGAFILWLDAQGLDDDKLREAP